MKTALVRPLFAALALWAAATGCGRGPHTTGDGGPEGGDGGGGGPDMGVAQCKPTPIAQTDAAIPPSGQKVNPGDVATACTKDTDCKQGTKPVCWTKNLLNNANFLPAPGGYCTSSCTQDTDCGVDAMGNPINLCNDFGMDSSGNALGKFCIGGCGDTQTCRHGATPNDPGYVCLILGVDASNNLITGCFPDSNLNCDPTQPSCTLLPMETTPEGGTDGGCFRQALENNHGGYCLPTCKVGDVGGCTMDQFGNSLQCLYLDFTQAADGTPTGDAFRGMLCFPGASSPKNPGDTCSFTDDCQDGYQCDNRGGGDKKCDKLCNLNGKSPKCGAGQTCTKRFGGCEAGLCK